MSSEDYGMNINPDLLPYKACPICGKQFWPTRAHRTYCSDECAKVGRIQVELDRQRHVRAKRRATLKCKLCGKPLPVRKVRFCSSECRQRHWRLYGRTQSRDKANANNKQ